jgi:predicted transposase YbfD/YdcC
VSLCNMVQYWYCTVILYFRLSATVAVQTSGYCTSLPSEYSVEQYNMHSTRESAFKIEGYCTWHSTVTDSFAIQCRSKLSDENNFFWKATVICDWDRYRIYRDGQFEEHCLVRQLSYQLSLYHVCGRHKKIRKLVIPVRQFCKFGPPAPFLPGVIFSVL